MYILVQGREALRDKNLISAGNVRERELYMRVIIIIMLVAVVQKYVIFRGVEISHSDVLYLFILKSEVHYVLVGFLFGAIF